MTKRAFEAKQKAFFIIFKELSVDKNCLRPGSAPLKVGNNSLCYYIKLLQSKQNIVRHSTNITWMKTMKI